MATLGDWISLVLIGMLVYAIYQGLKHTDEAKKSLADRMRTLQVGSACLLQNRGVSISAEGISIRSTHAAMDREAYVVRVLYSRRTPRKKRSSRVAPKLCSISSTARRRANKRPMTPLSL